MVASFVSPDGVPLHVPDVRLDERMPTILVQMLDGNNQPVSAAAAAAAATLQCRAPASHRIASQAIGSSPVGYDYGRSAWRAGG